MMVISAIYYNDEAKRDDGTLPWVPSLIVFLRASGNPAQFHGGWSATGRGQHLTKDAVMKIFCTFEQFLEWCERTGRMFHPITSDVEATETKVDGLDPYAFELGYLRHVMAKG